MNISECTSTPAKYLVQWNEHKAIPDGQHVAARGADLTIRRDHGHAAHLERHTRAADPHLDAAWSSRTALNCSGEAVRGTSFPPVQPMESEVTLDALLKEGDP